MRHSIPTHYALLAPVITLALGIVIGSQFTKTPSANTSNLDRPEGNLTVQAKWKDPQLTLVENESECIRDVETRYYTPKRESSFGKDPATALADAFEQKKGLELEQRLLTVIDHWAAILIR